jgi:hypothetical protein
MAHHTGVCRGAAKAAISNHGYGREKTGKGAHCRRFAGASLASYENTTNFGGDQAQNQGLLHLLLTNNSGEREYWSVTFHGPIFLANYLTRKKSF